PSMDQDSDFVRCPGARDFWLEPLQSSANFMKLLLAELGKPSPGARFLARLHAPRAQAVHQRLDSRLRRTVTPPSAIEMRHQRFNRHFPPVVRNAAVGRATPK